LTVLHLRGTKVTAEGLAAFQARLPGCRVTYTDGVLEPIDVDRRAAERTIVLGGGVRVNDSLDVIEAVAKLPAGPLTLNYVVLTDKPVADADLTVFRPCTKLREVHLAGTKVTNAGLAAFEACADLHQLSLGGTAVTDAGLAHFRRAGGLWFVSLVDTAVTDAGLDHLRNATKLSQVYLRKTRVTGPGLATFRGCRELLYLDLAGSPVTDEGISHLYACTKLGTLIVRGTKVTPKGLADFHAAVPGCKVEHDGGVIEAVDVDRIAAEWVTSVGGVVRINGGGIEFRDAAGLPPDRFTMTWVSLERAKFSDADLARLKAPAGLTHLGLNVPGATDAAMTHVAGIRGLKTLSLNGTAVTDFGLGRLHGCRSLRKLSIGGTRVTPAGIEAFRAAVPGCRVNPGGTQTIAPLDPERAAAEWVLSVGGAVRLDGRDRDLRSATDLPKERFALTGVKLAGIAVGNADLAEFKECVRLESLDLAGTNVAGTGLDHLKDCTKLTTLSLARSAFQDNSTDRFRHLPLTTLDLSDTPLTDVGVRRLKECRTLTSLDVRRTRVSGVVLAELREALPGCRIQHDGGVLEPKN
ncbi:MAG TPA: hypothetical protein VD866_31905, partial [Urbifossiella sp.]|nr:hypothetical protein [Urbifossiella sp.]